LQNVRKDRTSRLLGGPGVTRCSAVPETISSIPKAARRTTLNAVPATT